MVGPHHVVRHNGKHRLGFNCSFQHNGMVLNECLLPGTVMGPSLRGVLLCISQHSIAIAGYVRAVFHQVCLLPEERPSLHFLWHNLKRDNLPDVYKWQVLCFGTTCSHCCAPFALQTHVHNSKGGNEDVVNSVTTRLYVENCLASLPTPLQVKQLIDKMRCVLSSFPQVAEKLDNGPATCHQWWNLFLQRHAEKVVNYGYLNGKDMLRLGKVRFKKIAEIYTALKQFGLSEYIWTFPSTNIPVALKSYSLSSLLVPFIKIPEQTR